MYWFPNMRKFPTGGRFTVVSRKVSRTPLSKAVKKAFKLIVKEIQCFYEKSHFYYD